MTIATLSNQVALIDKCIDFKTINLYSSVYFFIFCCTNILFVILFVIRVIYGMLNMKFTCYCLRIVVAVISLVLYTKIKNFNFTT